MDSNWQPFRAQDNAQLSNSSPAQVPFSWHSFISFAPFDLAAIEIKEAWTIVNIERALHDDLY